MKALKDQSCGELRMHARGTRSPDRKRELLGELRRRVRNLRGAIIPGWERAERGADPERWDLLAR